MLKIIFLGTSGSIPTVERGMPSIAVKYEKFLMLFDCGEGTQRQMMKYKAGYGSIDSIFITHPHMDHFLGIFGLLETLRLSSPSPRQVDIFANVELKEYDFVKLSKMKKGTIYKKPGFTVSAYPVKHCKGSYCLVFQEDAKIKFNEKKAKALGLKGRMFSEIEKKGKIMTGHGVVRLEDVSWKKPGRKIVYTGDLLPDNSIIEIAKGADLLIHEATFASDMKEEAEERMHSTAGDAALAAKKAEVKKLILTHISPRYSDSGILLEEARRIFRNSWIAEDGMVLDVR